jgi:hypothetical protein
MKRIAIVAAAMLLGCHVARAQDLPGIELCTAEKRMERRTSCLQSNDSFLHRRLTTNAADTTLKLKAAADEIAALRQALAKLQATVDALVASSNPGTRK